MKIKTLLIIAIIILAAITAKLNAQSLTWLGTLGGDESEARALSSNGLVVVGVANDSIGNTRAFRWTIQTGMQDLGTLGGDWSEATDVSADGSVIVGWSYDSSGIYRAFRWTESLGMQDLGAGDYSKVYGVSADGLTIIINIYPNAYRWTPTGGLENLGNLGTNNSGPKAISSNGSVIVGYSTMPPMIRMHFAGLMVPGWNRLELTIVLPRVYQVMDQQLRDLKPAVPAYTVLSSGHKAVVLNLILRVISAREMLSPETVV